MWPPREASNFVYNFEARLNARISKLLDILASNFIVLCICKFYEHEQAKTNLCKAFCNKIKKKMRQVRNAGARCQVRGIRFLGPGIRFETQVPGSRCQVPGCQVSGPQFPGVQVPGSSIRKNKLWIDFYTCSCAFRAFFGYIVTCKTSDLREAITQTVTVTVTPY